MIRILRRLPPRLGGGPSLTRTPGSLSGGWRPLALLLALATLPASAAGFVQDRFAIGLWVPPQGSDHLRERYREIARANFNLVIGNSVSDAAAQIRLCRDEGLNGLIQDPGPGAPPPEGRGCWGYLVTDEPAVGQFGDLAHRIGELRRTRPGRLAYVNLFPNYASAAQLGTPVYDEYVARFVREAHPDVLSMDHYPVMRPDRDTRDAYLANVETLRREANAAGIPFWNFFNTMPFGPHSDPTEAQLRWQIHASIAAGAKGVLYFCYWTPGKGAAGAGEFPKGGAIITAEGLRTRHYDEARRINAEVQALGPTLMQLTGEGISRVHADVKSSDLPPGGPVRTITLSPGDPPAEFLVGRLRHRDGRRAILIVNHSVAYTAWPTVEFEAPLASVREVDRESGRERPPRDDSPELPGFQCSLGPGDARLFVLPR